VNKYLKLKKSCLIQLHHQFRDGSTKICAQRKVNNNSELQTFFEEIKLSHPLPKNAQWLTCAEESKYFVMVPA